MANRLEKVQHVLCVVIMIYYWFYNSILIAQFKKIIINFIGIICLQIVQCLPIHCLKKTQFQTLSGFDELMPQTWKDFLTISWFWILNKIVKSFLYPVNYVLTCWHWEFNTGFIYLSIYSKFTVIKKLLYTKIHIK